MSTATTTAIESSKGIDFPYEVVPVHPKFGCRIPDLDISKPLSEQEFNWIRGLLHQYGVVAIPNANLPDDESHVNFSRLFGEVEKSRFRSPHMRSLPFAEIFDISNLDENDEIVMPGNEKRITAIRGNSLWHADGSFNPRRTYVSMLRAIELPPKGTGGETEFADTRQAYEDLPEEKKLQIKDLVAVHSFLHNRQIANPDSELFKGRSVFDEPLARHKLVPIHEPTGRPMLYVTSYAHHIEGLAIEEGKKLLKELMEHATQPKYVLRHQWQNNGEAVIWDNTAVLHRATPGGYEGKYRRDMRRTCVMDSSTEAYGLNNQEEAKNQRNSS
ncbi:hypothetical protein PENARI_c005G06418 [Penicillium arizonense]|uniref:TauD/TfdA-like domain-containing protein n=1 Tax=Penicillium arizonense TaxID=1835702 RepID=A0A1F5LP81_PENAI|nr:hypothetical protein PENARI_c005G06418 [Penicillium arizonense]OGE54729.1 hypothetical protein PENARI_c005G06418 [Penicillium arizonense]